MIDEIKQYINRFVYLDDDAIATVLALYVVHTWSWQYSQTTPYLYIWSPLKQSGKTRLLEVLEVLTHDAVRASSISNSALYRVIEEREPTMLIDEVDTIYAGAKHEDLRGTLNSGYKRGGYSIRIRGGEVTDFSTFCPKVLAGINNFMIPDTVADRCISVELQRKPQDIKIEPFYHAKAIEEVEPLLDMIDSWVQNHEKSIKDMHPDPVKGISDRKWEIGEPLSVIGTLSKTSNSTKILKEVLTRDIPRNTLNPTERLMKDICEVFKDTDKIFSSDLAKHMGMSPKLLAQNLDSFDIKPRRIRIASKVMNGYQKTDMAPILDRNI